MRTTTRIALAALAIGIGTPALAQATTAADYVKQAGASDLFEKTEAKMMMKSADPSVRSFAQKMGTDHAKSTAMVKAAAKQDGMTPAPPMLTDDQKAMVSALKEKSGKERDALYVEQQKTAHQQALQLHQGFADAAPENASHLKSAAGQIAPVVQSHIDMLNQMPAA